MKTPLYRQILGTLIWLLGCAILLGTFVSLMAIVGGESVWSEKHSYSQNRIANAVIDSTIKIVLSCLVGLILIIVGQFGNRLVVFGARLRKRSLVLSELDTASPFVLYLRSFELDGETSQVTPVNGHQMIRVQQLEEALVGALSAVGPLIAIGCPQDLLPHLGADRVYLEGGDWQNEVKKLIRKSKLNVVRLGTTPGVLWELEACFQNSAPEHVLLLLPINVDGPQRAAAYASFLSMSQDSSVFHGLPPVCGPGNFIYFDPNWRGTFTQPGKKILLTNASMARRMRDELAPVVSKFGIKFRERSTAVDILRLTTFTLSGCLLFVLFIFAFGAILSLLTR